MDLKSFVQRLMTTRYARELETEVSRLHDVVNRECSENLKLRAENRALLNSILGIAGIPPIPEQDPPVLNEPANVPSTPRDKGKGSAIAPLRRRSWHQVTRGLEIASARKPQDKELP